MLRVPEVGIEALAELSYFYPLGLNDIHIHPKFVPPPNQEESVVYFTGTPSLSMQWHIFIKNADTHARHTHVCSNSETHKISLCSIFLARSCK